MKARRLGLLERFKLILTMLTFFLIKIAKQYLKKYRPKIIGVVSNFSDTATAPAVFCVLDVSVSIAGRQNSQRDLLLNLINAKTRPKTIFGWLGLILKAKFGLLIKIRDYPLIIILDFSRVKFKEMNQLLKFLPLDAAVINNLVQIDQNDLIKTKTAQLIKPAVKNSLALADESRQRRIEWKKKNKILSVLDSRGWAILNIDEPSIADLPLKTKAKIFSFSQKSEADLRALEILELKESTRPSRAPGQNLSGTNRHLPASDKRAGLSFKLICKGSVVPIKLPKIFTPKKIPAVLAGISAGVLQGLDMIKIAERVEDLE